MQSRHRPGTAPRRTQGGKVIPHATALLHRQRPFPERRKDPLHGILDAAHDKTVEQRDPAPATGTGQDAATRQKPEILQQPVKGLSLTVLCLCLGRCHGTRHPPPCRLKVRVVNRAGIAIAVAGIPDKPGYR